MSTVPAGWAGEVVAQVVSLVQDSVVAGLPGPKVRAVAPARPVPWTVTAVPPAVGPLLGLTEVTVGGAK